MVDVVDLQAMPLEQARNRDDGADAVALPNRLENRLFLANLTMPSTDVVTLPNKLGHESPDMSVGFTAQRRLHATSVGPML